MDSPEPTPGMGCVAMLGAIALAALLVTMGLPLPTASADLYIPVFIVTAVIVGIVGTPLYWLARRFHRANIRTAMAAGAITGACFPTLSLFGNHSPQAWIVAVAYGAAGATGGLVFFLISTAPAAPRRNAAAIFASTAASIVATVLIRPHLS